MRDKKTHTNSIYIMKIGLILSGGGARGIAHIGVLKALEEYDIKITHISGTSAGAIVGGFYAAGHSWETILKFFKQTSLFDYKKYARSKPGFIDTEKFYDDLKSYFPIDDFSILKKQLFITATNLMTGKLIVFKKRELIKPILASSAIPGILTPVAINKNVYIDGGVLNNFPLEPLLNCCDKIIGVYVNPLETTTVSKLKHSYQIVNRAFQIGFGNQCFSKFSDCDAIIAPLQLNKYGFLNMKNIDPIFKIGYDSAINVLKNFNY